MTARTIQRSPLSKERMVAACIGSKRRAATKPGKDVEKVTAAVLQITSTDDFVNPPELGIVGQLPR